MKPIFDIFSRKTSSKSKSQKEKVIVDYREKNSMVVSSLIELELEVEYKNLKVGDYLVKDVAIERKTVNDFISSMLNKRLTKQLSELSQYKNRLLIIEGIDEQDLYSERTEEKIGMHPNSVRGFLLSILLRFKTPIVYTKDSEDTAKFISVLAKRKEKELSLNVSKNNLTKKERMQFILEGFPNIGPKTAKKLLQNFKTLKNIFNSTEEEIKKLIGKKSESFRVVDEKY
ncbi:MAG: ERCC4 domain-containing protein [archaeon]